MNRSLLGVILSSTVLAHCGARLPQEVSINRPIASEQSLDLDKISFTEMKSGSPVTLGSYMRGHGLTHMLLTFGSTGCAVCMEKTRYLQQNLVGHYNLLSADADQHFELKGINVDPASKRADVLRLVEEESLDHLAWADPRGDVMMAFFQPTGLSLSVPLTVLINNRGVMWRITSKEHVTPDQIMRRVASSLGSDGTSLPPPPPPKPEPQPLPVPDLTLLGQERPDRLAGVKMDACGRGSSVLSEVMAGKKFRIVIASHDDCSDQTVCGSVQRVVQRFLPTCNAETGGCGLVVLAGQVQTCDDVHWRGGGEFFQTFRDHFNWHYAPVQINHKWVLPDVAGPLTMVFDAAGKLVLSHEGALTPDELAQRWQIDHWTARAAGPNWALAIPTGTTSFSQVRATSRYTLTVFWSTICTGCVEEISAWHASDQVLSWCRARPDFCQVQSVETGYPDSGLPSDVASYLQGLLHGSPDFDGFDKLGWNIPLAVDMISPTGADADHRWFDGWVRTLYGPDPRSILYDREGKIVGSWIAKLGETGPFDMLKKLEGSK